uniref:Uncharacterized protein n=1 Tax=Oryza barthii TaxID=65489 RepID=A0A0D3FGQ2_9ORYZ
MAADLASGNATTTAAVSGDDDHDEMGIWGATLQAFPLQAHFQPAEPRIRLLARLGSDMEP